MFFIDFFNSYFFAGAALAGAALAGAALAGAALAGAAAFAGAAFAGASAFISVLAGSAFLECLPLAKDITGASAIVRAIAPIITFFIFLGFYCYC
jgi:hypothetical protein